MNTNLMKYDTSNIVDSLPYLKSMLARSNPNYYINKI